MPTPPVKANDGEKRIQDAPHEGMIWIDGGTFRMGSDRFYPEEGPAHDVRVDGFWMDLTPVTNRQFAAFVEATGYKTVAEEAPDPALYPGADPAMLQPGSLVFRSPSKPQEMRFWGDWWQYILGACWRRPDGTVSLSEEDMDKPVVHVAYRDAQAFAQWAGKTLPTEAEWEFAARGGLQEADYAWGNEFRPNGAAMANTWDGQFPMRDPLSSAPFASSVVGSYPANGYGLYDMIGNVWEWTEDFWTSRHPEPTARSCCAPVNPRVEDAAKSFDPKQQKIEIPRKVLKGGSHLCAPSYCQRYRPAARQAEMIDSATTHLGFRCIIRTQADPDMPVREMLPEEADL